MHRPLKIPYHDGTILSFHAIFVRCARQYPDEYFLARLGITDFRRTNFRRTKTPFYSDRYVLVTEDTEWVHILDDLYYSMWRTPIVRESIPLLAKKHDVFRFAVGDSDDSLEFEYYHDGHLVRKYVAEDPHFEGAIVVEDQGLPLSGEKVAWKERDQLKKMFALTRAIGIDLRHGARPVRVYTKRFKP